MPPAHRSTLFLDFETSVAAWSAFRVLRCHSSRLRKRTAKRWQLRSANRGLAAQEKDEQSLPPQRRAPPRDAASRGTAACEASLSPDTKRECSRTISNGPIDLRLSLHCGELL